MGARAVARSSGLLQFVPRRAKGSQRVEALTEVALMLVKKFVGHGVHERALFDGDCGSLDQALTQWPPANRLCIRRVWPAQFSGHFGRDKAQMDGQGLKQQLAISAIPRHGGSPLLRWVVTIDAVENG
jgi:hypothetical protein